MTEPFVSATVVAVVAASEGAAFAGCDFATIVPGFFIAAGETAVFFAAAAATPFGCSFRTDGEVAVALGASEVRVVVVFPGAVSDAFVAVVLTSSGFLAAAVVVPVDAVFAAIVLVAPAVRGTVLLVVVVVLVDLAVDAPSVVVVPLVSELFAATVLFAVVVVVVDVFEGTEALDTALEGREVTVRVVVVVDSLDELVFPAAAALAVVLDVTDLETAVLVTELALADFVALDEVVDATFVRAAAAVEDAAVVLEVAVLATSVVGFFAANVDLVDVALAGRSLTPFIVALVFAAVVAFLASAAGTGGLRAAPVVLLLPTREGAALLLAVLSLDAAEVGFVDTLDAGGFFAAGPVVDAFGLLGLLAVETAAAAAAAAATATVAAAATPVAETSLDAVSASVTLLSSTGFSSFSRFSATSTSGCSCGNGSCGWPTGSDTPIRSAKPCDACSSCSLLVSCWTGP